MSLPGTLTARLWGRLNMDDAVRRALEVDRTIDITTTGRKTGQPRRKEIWFHNIHGRLYITGTPGSRDWYANLVAMPRFTFHLKHSTRADLNAWATLIVIGGDKLDFVHSSGVGQ